MSPLELFAAAIGVFAVWMTVRQNPWCWPIGLVMVLIYGWIFFEAKLYSDMLLQGVYAVLQLYGWRQWTRGGEQHQGRRVSRLGATPLLSGLAVGALGALVLGYLMQTHTDAAVPWLDAGLTAFSLVAQWWMARKHLQCWALWFILDVLYVALFMHKGLYLTAALYALFVVIAARGWIEWRRELQVRAA